MQAKLRPACYNPSGSSRGSGSLRRGGAVGAFPRTACGAARARSGGQLPRVNYWASLNHMDPLSLEDGVRVTQALHQERHIYQLETARAGGEAASNLSTSDKALLQRHLVTFRHDVLIGYGVPYSTNEHEPSHYNF